MTPDTRTPEQRWRDAHEEAIDNYLNAVASAKTDTAIVDAARVFARAERSETMKLALALRRKR